MLAMNAARVKCTIGLYAVALTKKMSNVRVDMIESSHPTP